MSHRRLANIAGFLVCVGLMAYALYAQYGIEDSASAAVEATKSKAKQSGIVWKRHADGSLEPVKIALGITDHAVTEVMGLVNGKLAEGDDVVTASLGAKSTAPATIRR